MFFLPSGLLGRLLPSIWNVLSWQPPCSASLPTIHLLTFYSDSTSSISHAYLSFFFFFFKKYLWVHLETKNSTKCWGYCRKQDRKSLPFYGWASSWGERNNYTVDQLITNMESITKEKQWYNEWIGAFLCIHGSPSSQYLSHFVITSCLSLFPTHVGKYIFHECKV